MITILALGGLTAWGTFVEANYQDAVAAQKIVYHSIWMYGAMGLLSINLIAVMVDRWPWQKKHTGFILAHIGILILLAGSLVTRYQGIDGSMTIKIGEKSKYIVVSNTDLTLYSSFDGSSYTKLYDREVDFFSDRPSPTRPHEIDMPQAKIKVLGFHPYAFRDQKVVATEETTAGAAVRFQLQNDRVSVTEWLVQTTQGREVVKDLGPAQIVFGNRAPSNEASNVIVMTPRPDGTLAYEIRSARAEKKTIKGIAKPGDVVETGWMGLVLRILKYMPHAKEEISFKPTHRKTDLTTEALEIEFNGKKHWLSLNSMLKLFTDDAVYILTYANRRLDSGLDITLTKFDVGRYQGTMRAASYESTVDVPGVGSTLISMNEPLKHNGFTFYQASFNEDEQGRPIESVLSVNRDPGRWIKYLGAFLIVFGCLHLFYYRRLYAAFNKGAAQ